MRRASRQQLEIFLSIGCHSEYLVAVLGRLYDLKQKAGIQDASELLEYHRSIVEYLAAVEKEQPGSLTEDEKQKVALERRLAKRDWRGMD